MPDNKSKVKVKVENSNNKGEYIGDFAIGIVVEGQTDEKVAISSHFFTSGVGTNMERLLATSRMTAEMLNRLLSEFSSNDSPESENKLNRVNEILRTTILSTFFKELNENLNPEIQKSIPKVLKLFYDK